MKRTLLLVTIFLHITGSSQGQEAGQNSTDSLKVFLGSYQAEINPIEKTYIRMHDESLLVDFWGKGKTTLTKMPGNRFRVDGVRPEAIIEFVNDSFGRVYKYRWIQDIGVMKWYRVKAASPVEAEQKEQEGPYEGNFRTKDGKVLVVRKDAGAITVKITGELPQVALRPVSADRFAFGSGDMQMFYQFQTKTNGKFQRVEMTRTGAIDMIKIAGKDSSVSLVTRSSNPKNGFTRADSLRGMLTSLRTCYDVLFYNLDVKVVPDTRYVHGNNIIRFRATEDFDKMQVDLYANMEIKYIKYRDTLLSYKREFNAVFVEFPHTVRSGSVAELEIAYAGQPQAPDMSTLTGGFLWYRDKNGTPWIESVCQGAGASLWWPCKDHLSDKPDSMKISVTVPKGLTDISNGRLLGTTQLPNNLTRFDWYVSYPITNYNVVVNIGDYVHFADKHITEADTLMLNFYCLSYNRQKAEQVFKGVKPMLQFYEKAFGTYPFKRDGFTAIESLYPMEHQSAISIGSINNPIKSNRFDAKELIRTMWHESAHEWWGNSVTCSDMADLWIHEAFATYTETLNHEVFNDHKTALKHLHKHPPENREPIIGTYNVNHFHLGDMYSKGALMLHTLRSVMDNDSIFFEVLRGLQDHFKYQSVNTESVVSYINERTRKEYTAFFDQYLRHDSIPELELRFTKEGGSWLLNYRWNAKVKGFNMPVKVSPSENEWAFITPTSEWQQLPLKYTQPRHFKVDTDNFYITVKTQPAPGNE